MDTMTSVRLKKHSGTGHKLTPFPANHKREGHIFCRCLCGWLGWLEITEEQLKERSESNVVA